MSRTSEQSLHILDSERCSAILRTQLESAVVPAMQAAVDAGFKVIEFTLNTPGALEQIAAFSAQDELLVGAGTVLSCDDAQAAVDAGASFIVSPVTDIKVIGWCCDHDVLCIPGTYTPTEMMLAHRAGAQVVKLFPGPVDGPAYLRACKGPLPHLKIFPTSGVTEANAAEFLAAGAFGLGFVGCLFDQEDLAQERFEAIRERGRRMVRIVQQAARTD